MSRHLYAALFSCLIVAGCGALHHYTDAEIPTISDLGRLMWSQQQVMKPALKLLDKTSLAADDYTTIEVAGKRLILTSPRLKDPSFSKGTDFDDLADALAATSVDLIAAAEAKNDEKARQALRATQGICESCHAQYK